VDSKHDRDTSVGPSFIDGSHDNGKGYKEEKKKKEGGRGLKADGKSQVKRHNSSR